MVLDESCQIKPGNSAPYSILSTEFLAVVKMLATKFLATALHVGNKIPSSSVVCCQQNFCCKWSTVYAFAKYKIAHCKRCTKDSFNAYLKN